MKNIKRNDLLFTIILILIAFVFFFLIKIEPRNEIYISDYEYNVVYEGDNINIYSLDSNVDSGDIKVEESNSSNFGFVYVPETTVDGALPYIGIGSSYMSYNISSYDELLYSYGEKERKIANSNATTLRIIKIPPKYLGEEVDVRFKLRVQKDTKIPTTIYIGERKNIIKQILKQESIEILFALFMLVMASIMIVLAIISRILKLSSNNYLSIGFFILFLGTYIFMQTQTSYFFIRNSILAYFIEYTSASTFMASYAYILYQHLRGKKRYIGRIIYEVMILNITIQTFLAITGFIEFIYYREFSFVIVYSASVIMLYTLLIKRDPKYPLKKESRLNKIIIASSIMLFTGQLIAGIMYNISPSLPFLIPIFLTLILHIMILFFLAINTYAKDYKKSLKLNQYKASALYDNLTKVGSRYAYDADISDFKRNINKYNSIAVILTDINNLKIINDSLGHDAGDMAIYQMGLLLKRLEESCYEYKAKAYRIGGDEFIFIIIDSDYNAYMKVIDRMDSLYKSYLLNNPKSLLQFSYGSAYAKADKDLNLDKLIKKADKEMYENKAKKKLEKKVSIDKDGKYVIN